MNGVFEPTLSTNMLWLDDDMERCLTAELESIDDEITALASAKANAVHIHNQYADVNHAHSGFAAFTHTHSNYALSSHTHTEQAECTAATETDKLTEIFSAMSVKSIKQVCANVDGAIWIWDIYKASDSYGVVKAWKYGHVGNPDSKERNFLNGSWQNWAWVNPPMAEDVEYLTTERWNGKAVYTKLINCGEAENHKGIDITSLGAVTIFRYEGTIWGTIPIPYIHATLDNAWSIWVTVRPEQITMYCGESRVGGTVRIRLWYTKN